jgi:hypothetical protein
MNNEHMHLGADAPLDPEAVEVLKSHGVPVPEPIEETDGSENWQEPGPGPFRVPPDIATAARAAGCSVVNSDEDLRTYVEARGYALVPLRDLDKVQIDENGPYLAASVESGSSFSGVLPLANSVERVDTGNPKDALGMKKPNLSLVPPASKLYQAQAMMDGAQKYGPYNWRDKPVKAMVYISAAQRHIDQYLDGEVFDPISGVPHLGHALACFGILADATETGNLIDDRPVKGPAGEMIRRFNDSQSFAK